MNERAFFVVIYSHLLPPFFFHYSYSFCTRLEFQCISSHTLQRYTLLFSEADIYRGFLFYPSGVFRFLGQWDQVQFFFFFGLINR